MPICIGLSALIFMGIVNNGIYLCSEFLPGIYLGYTIGNIIAPPENKIPVVKGEESRSSIFPLVYNDGISINYTLKF